MQLVQLLRVLNDTPQSVEMLGAIVPPPRLRISTCVCVCDKIVDSALVNVRYIWDVSLCVSLTPITNCGDYLKWPPRTRLMDLKHDSPISVHV